ncbi:MAG: guanylate kinase [Planctomycetota bacterium]|jgi:guanylate kinase
MSDEANKKGRVVIVSGPSGVGKSTICKRVMERLDNAYLSISATTRLKSDSEVDGEDYWFITEQEFRDRIDKGLFLEYAQVFENFYGTPRDKVDEALVQCRTVILEIDVQGAKQAKTEYPDAVMIFILPPSHKELAERMNSRAREDDKTAELRLDLADNEIAAAWQYYDHMVINDDLEQAVREVTEIIDQNVGGTE